MEKIKFNHDGRSLAESMSISKDRKVEIEAIVLYTMIVREIMVKNLFDSRDDAPRNMSTKSGVLEKLLEYATDYTEAVYIAYEYCFLDKRTDDPIEGKMLCTVLAMKIKDLDLDEDKFIEWYVARRAEFFKDGK